MPSILPTGKLSKQSRRTWKETPHARKTRIPKAVSPLRPGHSHGSEDGPATTANQVPSSCSMASFTSTQSSMGGPSEMCESRSPPGEGGTEFAALAAEYLRYSNPRAHDIGPDRRVGPSRNEYARLSTASRRHRRTGRGRA